MSRLNKFRALSGAEKKILLAALCGLPMVQLKLRILGFETVLVRLQSKPLAAMCIDVDPSNYPAQTSRIVNVVARFLFRREACLERSIMLWSLLRRKGIESELKIGVATEDQGLQAHAWIEIDGDAVNESPHIFERFTSFYSSLIADRKDFS